MTCLQTVNLGPVLSSRRLFDVERQCLPIGFRLTEMLGAGRPVIPPLPDEAAGYRLHSVPVEQADALIADMPDFVSGRRHRFERRYIDMGPGFDAYMDGFSGKTRSTLRRKIRKFADHSGGAIDIRCYRTASEVSEFLDMARDLSAKTYQERHLDAGLPGDDEFRRETLAKAQEDRVRAFLLLVGDRPVSYLFLPIEGEGEGRVLRYEYLGYDPEYARLSPGTVLQMEALQRLMAENRFAYFDFTSGDGPHKQLFGTRRVTGMDCVLLRRSLDNRALLNVLDGADRLIEAAGGLADKFGAKTYLRSALRRG